MTISLPAINSPVNQKSGAFSTAWYQFFRGLLQASPNTGDAVISGSGLVPSGWAQANGQALDRVRFSDLFRAYGVAYGAGDGMTTFNLPNWPGPGGPSIYIVKL